jgi:hypothetical protein
MNITEAVVTNIRVMEDTTWLLVFWVMIIAGYKYAEASFGAVRRGYIALILTGASGLLWKGIGLYSRVFAVKEPELLFSVGREVFEGTTGALFTGACLLLASGLHQIYSRQKKVS